LKVEVVPWPVALAWLGLVILLLVVGAVGIHRSSQGSQTQVLLGWLAVALVAIGQMFSLELTMLGFLIFGAAALMAPRVPRGGGVLLALGAVGSSSRRSSTDRSGVSQTRAPRSFRASPSGLSLLLIALGCIVLGVLRRTDRVIV